MAAPSPASPDAAKIDNAAEEETPEPPPAPEPPPLLAEPPNPPPLLEPVHGDYVALKTSNVRMGPGMRYVVVGHVGKGRTVEVQGKVQGKNWYALDLHSGGKGYIYADLLTPGTAVRAIPPQGELDADQIRKVLVGHTVRLEDVVGKSAEVEYYDVAESRLRHYENGTVAFGKWRIRAGEHAQFCRYWQVGDQKRGRCYIVVSNGSHITLRPVSSLSAFARSKQIVRRVAGDHFDSMVEDLKKR